MSSTDMLVSIIIPLYKRTDWIGRCIEKLLIQDTRDKLELIIVDDGSPNVDEIEKTINKYRERSTIDIRLFKRPHAGPAAARNRGVKAASGDILCFIDDDSLPEKEWIREISKPFDSPHVSLVSGRTLSFDRSGLPLLLEHAIYPRKSWASCNIAYRRNVFETLRGFDEYYLDPSWEDNDLGLRAQWAGYYHCYNEKAIIYHPHERSLSEYKKKCFLNGSGAAAFSRKYACRKPFWSIIAPLVICRRFIYCFSPLVWAKRVDSAHYLRYMWSLYSMKGFMNALLSSKKGSTRV